jgi:hypothetical protein
VGKTLRYGEFQYPESFGFSGSTKSAPIIESKGSRIAPDVSVSPLAKMPPLRRTALQPIKPIAPESVEDIDSGRFRRGGKVKPAQGGALKRYADGGNVMAPPGYPNNPNLPTIIQNANMRNLGTPPAGAPPQAGQMNMESHPSPYGGAEMGAGVPFVRLKTGGPVRKAKGGFIKGAIKHPGRMKNLAAKHGVSVHQEMEADKGSKNPSLRAAANLGLRLTGGDLSPRKGKR